MKFPLTSLLLRKLRCIQQKTSAGSLKGRSVICYWVLLLVLIALFRYPDLGPLLLLLAAAHFIFVGIANLFPQHYFRKAYPQSELAGKTYQADLDDNGFMVSGDSCSWRVAWSEVHLKGENKRVFMFYAKGTLFIFGKSI